ncbi:MAG: DNA polymerase III subunit gamma/tau [Polyangiaceae bacterium]|nr:DNA polymerase III subunit gamma/tau [Polyangiaceae bacterium]
MSYLVLARKWRPQTFSDLVGQEHVKRTLENAIAQDRVAHAFLFTGVRGVGKTTSARILAKALCCERGPTASPCLACAPCLEIAAGQDLDVQEIDGASYNGVDEVRRLQEGLPFRPQRDRFKVFIIDEVHMLSAAAWNAFLKTLEEPPPHVKFIFATTEVHKVPVTILSRCQRYDFRMISAATIAARLRFVLGEERLVADDAAVSLLAREARGSMRDAMSLLDQAIAWSGEALVGEEVARVLGVASRAALLELTAAVIEGDPAAALAKVAALVESGHDLTHVARDLLGVLRDVVVSKVAPASQTLLELAPEEREATARVAMTPSAEDLVRVHQGLSRALDETVRSGLPRASLEVALVRLALRPPLTPLDGIVARLAELERRLGGGAPPRGGGGGGGGARPQGGPPARPQAPPPPRHGGGPQAVGLDAPIAVAGNTALSIARVIPIRPLPPPPARPAPEPARVPGRPSEAPPRPGAARAQARTIDPSAPLPPVPEGVDVAAVRALTAALAEESRPYASAIEHGAMRAANPRELALVFPEGSFLVQQARDPDGLLALSRAARAALGEGVVVSIEEGALGNTGLTVAKLTAREAWERREAARAVLLAHPAVAAAIEGLGASVLDVRLDDPRLQDGPASGNKERA